MSSIKFVNIAKLMTAYNFEIGNLSDTMKCAKCKLVLKNACQVPCGCKFCRICIDNMIMSGDEFCPGVSEDCGESSLSYFTTDYSVNNSIAKITVKCPHDGCLHKCELVIMEDHLRECPRKTMKCPFTKLGCKLENLAAEEMDGHLQQDNRNHIDILIGMITNMKIEIANNKSEIERLKHELVLKDEHIGMVIDQMVHVENENKFIKNEIKLVKNEKVELADQVQILSEKIERETCDRRENVEIGCDRIIEYVDREKAAITAMIGSNKNEVATDMKSIRKEIGLVNQGAQSIKLDICSMKAHVQSIQAQVELKQVDVMYEWVIDADVEKSRWNSGDRISGFFTGAIHPYRYRLAAANAISTGSLYIQLRIYRGLSDEQLEWPFNGRVVITISERNRREMSRSVSQQCRIDKPVDNGCKYSDYFVFPHSELIGAGLNLSCGVCLSCVIVPEVSR